MKTLTTLVIAAPILLAGCATNQEISRRSSMEVGVFFNSAPQGAQVVMNNEVLCTTPCGRRVYTLSNLSPSADVLVRSPVTYRWNSGATLTNNIVITRRDIATHGTDLSFTVNRPQNAPNLHIDMSYALELEKLAEMRRQTEVAQQAKWDAERAARNAADAAEKARKKTYTCDRIGSTVHCF